MKELIRLKLFLQTAPLKPYDNNCLELGISKASLDNLIKCIVASHSWNSSSLKFFWQNSKASATELDKVE